MISIEDRTQFTRAEAKAKEVKPHVSMVEFGTYRVSSSQADHDPYTVRFSKDQDGHWQGECTCKAHTKGNKPIPCFHLVSAYQAHKIQVGVRQQVRAAQEAAQAQAEALEPDSGPFCHCGNDAHVWTGSEWLCWPHALELAQEQEQAAPVKELVCNGWVVCPGCGAEMPLGNRPEDDKCLNFGCHASLKDAKPVELSPVEQARADAVATIANLSAYNRQIEYTEAQADFDRACLFG